MRATIEDDLGPVELLVANAGGSPIPPGSIEDITAEEWHSSIDANLTATFLTVKAFLPGMKDRRRGTVITMSSAAARRPTARSPIAYAAAKAGIDLLTKEIALQAGPFGIRCQGSWEFPRCDHGNSPPWERVESAGRMALMASRWARIR